MMIKQKRIQSIFIFFLLLIITSIAIKYTKHAQKDQIHSLPDTSLSDFHSNQFSGFLSVSETRRIHYMYFESERDPGHDPVIFWTNGGPGCSGLLGLFTEFGPWRPTANGTLLRNPFTWTKYANIVFLEQPVGVGFSHFLNNYNNNQQQQQQQQQNNDESFYSKTFFNDFIASKDNLLIIQQFFQRFPERSQQDFFISSESYGGHYIPQWTMQILNNPEMRKHFKGFLLGNPYTSYGSGSIAMTKIIWGLQLIDKPTWDTFKEHECDVLTNDAYIYIRERPECFDLMDDVEEGISRLNPYSLEYPVCVADYPDLPTTTAIKQSQSKQQQQQQLQQQTHEIERLRHAHLSAQQLQLLKHQVRARRHLQHQQSQQQQQQQQQEEEGVSSDGSTVQTHVTTAAGAAAGGGVDALKDVNIKDVKDELTEAQVHGYHTLHRHLLQRHMKEMDSALPYDPCVEDNTIAYLNRIDVQIALHVHQKYQLPLLKDDMFDDDYFTSDDDYDGFHEDDEIPAAHRWDFCQDYVNYFWSFTDVLGDTTALYQLITNHPHLPDDFRMLVYSGDIDGVCATIGTQHWIYNVLGKDAVSELHQPWSYNDIVYGKQLGGYVTKFKRNLSFMSVRYARHEVPSYQPQKAEHLFQLFIEGSKIIFDNPDVFHKKHQKQKKKDDNDSNAKHRRTLEEVDDVDASWLQQLKDDNQIVAATISTAVAVAVAIVLIILMSYFIIRCMLWKS